MKKEILRIHNLSVNYGIPNMVENISLTLMAGEIIGFAGLNDSGKDFLTDILLGRIDEYVKGTFLCGKKLSRLGELCKTTYLVCRKNYCFQSWTAAQYLGLIDYSSGILPFSQVKLTKAVSEFLASINLDLDPRQKLSELSRVDLCLLDVARALYQGRQLIVIRKAFDDYSEQDFTVLKARLQPLIKDQATLVINTQSKPALKILSDELFFFDRGLIWKKLKNRDSWLTNEHLDESAGHLGAPDHNPKTTLSADDADMALTIHNLISAKYKNIYYLKKGRISLLQVPDYEERLQLFNCLSGRDHRTSATLSTTAGEFPLSSYEDFVHFGIVSIWYNEIELLGRMSVADNLLLPSLRKLNPLLYLFNYKKLNTLVTAEVLRFANKEITTSRTMTFNDQLALYYERWLIYKPRILILINPFFRCDNNDIIMVQNYIQAFLKLGTHIMILPAHGGDGNLTIFDEYK